MNHDEKIKALKLIINNPANNLTTTSVDLIKTIITSIDLQKHGANEKAEIEQLLDYSALGYDVYFTSIYGKDGIVMIKRHSHKCERKIYCQQIFDHEFDKLRLNHVLNFMYEDIKKQEESGVFQEID